MASVVGYRLHGQPRLKARVDRYGPAGGWILVIAGFVLQFGEQFGQAGAVPGDVPTPLGGVPAWYWWLTVNYAATMP